MAELTYRAAVSAALAREMERDDRVVLLGEDIASGGVFKTTGGLAERFGAERVRDTPISEQAIIGAGLGAAMAGQRPVAEIMFSDFYATCWDQVANEMAKVRYMTNGQVSAPMVIRSANGGGLGFGAQHSQSIESWAMTVPGLKVVAPATPADVAGLLAAAVRDDDPVLFFEHKALYARKGEVPDVDHVVPLGQARITRRGDDVTLVALASTVAVCEKAADLLADAGVGATVVDLRTLVPFDAQAVLESVRRTTRLVVVEEGPGPLGWSSAVSALVAEEALFHLDAPIVRVTGATVPLPVARPLEGAARPSAQKVVDAVRAMA